MFLIEDPAGRRPVIRGAYRHGQRPHLRAVTHPQRDHRGPPPTSRQAASTRGPRRPAPRSSAARLSVGAEVTLAGTLRGDRPDRHVDGRHEQPVHRRGLRAAGTRPHGPGPDQRRDPRRVSGSTRRVGRRHHPAGRRRHPREPRAARRDEPSRAPVSGGRERDDRRRRRLPGWPADDRRARSTSAAPRWAASAPAARSWTTPAGTRSASARPSSRGRSGWSTASPRPGWSLSTGRTIEGRLQFTGGSFSCPAPAPRNEHGHAIEAISATVRGGIDLGWKTVSPSVDFTDAATTFLADDPATWPERFTIAGLTYDRFEKPQGAQPKRIWDQAARCAWLSRQTEFDSGPYEQAARVFRQHGYAQEAEQILIAQRRHARQVGRSGASVAAARHRRRLRHHRLRVPAVARPVAAGRAARPGRRLAGTARQPGHAAGDERQRGRVRDQRPADHHRSAAAPSPASQRPRTQYPIPAATARCAASARCCTRSTPWSR